MKPPKPWSRLLWGVELSSTPDRTMLIGAGWHLPLNTKHYYDEPTRALLFNTRKSAREYCKAQHDKYRGRIDCCKKWRFNPVRVIEIVRKEGQ